MSEIKILNTDFYKKFYGQIKAQLKFISVVKPLTFIDL